MALLLTCGEVGPVAAQKIKGVTLDARADPGPGSLRALRDLGVTHVSLVPFGFQPALDAPAIRMNPEARYYSESDAGIRTLAREAKALGMHLVLKPHLWVGRSAWTADIAMRSEADWLEWERQYRTYILHYARLSAEIEAPVFVVATELAKAVRARPGYWRRLIREIRALYPGQLTYAANWWEDYESVPFWDALDYVGVQAYFPIGEGEGPNLASLRAGWRTHLRALERVARRTGKPILFTELGYRSIAYAAREPWRWPERDEQAPSDESLQARLYDAFFREVWSQRWLAGVVLWKFYPSARLNGARIPLDFTPQGKAAEGIIRRHFRR